VLQSSFDNHDNSFTSLGILNRNEQNYIELQTIIVTAITVLNNLKAT